MTIKELVDLIGGYASVRIVDEDYNVLAECIGLDVPEEFGNNHIKIVYAKNDTINIITSLDKVRRRWYNRERKKNAE